MAKTPKATDIFSHWHAFKENFQASPKDFYSDVEAALRKRQIPDITFSRVDWREGGILSAKREYLRVRRKELVFDLCGAPFGNAFFFSSWLGELPSGFWALVAFIPYFGPLLIWSFRRRTYYREDTTQMFLDLVHCAVMEVVDAMTATRGIPALVGPERTPIMRGFGKR